MPTDDTTPTDESSITRRAAPRRATRVRQKLGNPRNGEQKRSAYVPRLRTYTQPMQLFAAGEPLAAHTQPALRTGLMAPAWRLLHVSRPGGQFLTWLDLTGDFSMGT